MKILKHNSNQQIVYKTRGHLEFIRFSGQTAFLRFFLPEICRSIRIRAGGHKLGFVVFIKSVKYIYSCGCFSVTLYEAFCHDFLFI